MKRFIIYGMLLALSGCGRIVEWGVNSFPQGKDLVQKKEPAWFVRTARVYDQFTTCAIFDALWLSDAVKIAYADVSSTKHGRSHERREAAIRRQIEENRHFISFYILSQQAPLGDAQSDWGVFLRIDGDSFSPVETKGVDLDPIYKAFFGKRYNRFQDIYLVKFDAKDTNDQFLIDETTAHVELIFRSAKKETVLAWDLKGLQQ